MFVTGSLQGATSDAVPFCPVYDNGSGPGVWYTLVGTGGLAFASANSSQTFVDVTIKVFTGSCDQLQCVADLEQESDQRLLWTRL